MLTVHLIPNAHLDPAWLWDWREGLNEAIATCRCVAELMEQNPDVTFVRGEAFLYEHIERHDPELFARIRSLIEQGRWEIAGGAMLQPDTNLGAGESYVRQYLYGQAYFRSRFGIVPEIVLQVDSFGHAAGLPSIYAAAGCRYAVQCRPSQRECPTPSRLFRWRGPDGAEILTANLESYAVEYERKDPQYTLAARIRRAAEQAPAGSEDWVLLLGLGDHGGGLNRQMLAELREHMAHPPQGCVLKFSTLADFFRRIESARAGFPVVEGELQYSFRGCYTSAAAVKRSYRAAENGVLRAERWASAAAILGKSAYPADCFRGVWRDVLFNQFHDILPGTSIERVCGEAIDQLGQARHQCRGIENAAALSVFLNVDTSAQPGVPILLFNPHGRPFHGPVEVEWPLDYRPLGPGGEQRIVRHVAAIAPSGERILTQFLPTEMLGTSEWRIRSCFEASVPACGYVVYWMLPSAEPVPGPQEMQAGRTGPLFIDNGHIRIEHRHGENGIRVMDSQTGAEWFDAPAGAGIVLDDPGDSWGGGIQRWDKVVGRFETERVEILCAGPIKASMLMIGRCGNSRLIQVFSLHRGQRRVHCGVRLLWQEPGCLGKLVFPAKIDDPRGRFHSPYAVVERAAEQGEVPATTWACVVGRKGGVGLANSGQYGFDIAGGALRMSVVRSPYYGSTVAPAHKDFTERPRMDMGLHELEYVLTTPDEAPAAARELNMPVHTTLGFRHPGTLPARQSLIAIEPPEVELAAVKQAEDDRGWIVRLWETSGRQQEASIRILDQDAGSVAVPPHKLLTLRITRTNGKWTLETETLTEVPARGGT